MFRGLRDVALLQHYFVEFFLSGADCVFATASINLIALIVVYTFGVVGFNFLPCNFRK